MILLILNILIGLVVLLAGRQLFWFFVGAAGFLAGLVLTTRFLDLQPQWLVVLIAIVIGIIGALLAVFLQRLVVGIAGFFAGASATSLLLDTLNMNLAESVELILLIIAGIIAAILVAVLFDWALIFLSSLTGASLIIQALTLEPVIERLVFLGLFVLGFLVQATILLRREPAAPPPPEETPA